MEDQNILDILYGVIKSQQNMIEKLVETNANYSMNFIPMFMGLLKNQISVTGLGGQQQVNPDQQFRINEKFTNELLKRMKEGPKS
jgi:hypothetical protein